MSSDASAPESGRYTGLDGLRGLAAVAVLLTHLVPLAPAMAHLDSGEWRDTYTSWEQWLAYTPARFFWMAEESVFVFFVLSGFVLAVAAGRGGARSGPGFWRAYYPSRALRLYLPIWASLLMAWLLVQTVTRPDLLTRHLPYVPEHHDAGTLLWHGVTLFGSSSLNLPLWSLQWELWFSLLLPLYLAVARPGGRTWSATLVLGSLVMIGVGLRLGNPALQYLPIFLLGVVLAYRRDDVVRFGAAAASRGRWVMPVVFATAVLLVTARYSVVGAVATEGPTVLLATVASVVGATLLVVIALVWAAADRVLNRPCVQYLGQRSFSLYLVHMPVLTALTAQLGTDAPWILFPACLAASFAMAEIFYRIVERPAHRLARAMARGLRAGPDGSRKRHDDPTRAVAGVTGVNQRH